MKDESQAQKEIRRLLLSIYGEAKGEEAYPRILELIGRYKVADVEEGELFSEKDVVLITYGDSLKRQGGDQMPLETLRRFACNLLQDVISTIHILPCFPYSSDDGFSVIDYAQINPELGDWQDIRKLGKDFKLMFDLVLNHISAQGPWFKKYLAGEKGFEELAIEMDPSLDLSGVTRPRALPLLTEFQKDNGETVHLWTTFSADQVDLNFESIDVLLKMVEILLLYAKEGASIIRQDAIAYLWKEPGTTCIHLPQTHDMVKLLRQIYSTARSDGIILTETNVPHAENISYFGNGHDEAQMVYNFSLPPLLVYTFLKEDTSALTRWASTLETPSDETTFFNFSASHDGIGVRPLEGIIPPEELEEMITMVKRNGGRVSYKRNPDGSDSPYELNIAYVDAFLKKGTVGGEDDPLHARRFLASQAIQMVMPGVPGVYIHSILGSRNWNEGVEQTGRARTINREKLDVEAVTSELSVACSFRHQVFNGYARILRARRQQPAFHPNAPFEILDAGSGVFLVKRTSRDGRQTLYAFTNVSSCTAGVNLETLEITGGYKDLLSGEAVTSKTLELNPYQVAWLSNT